MIPSGNDGFYAVTDSTLYFTRFDNLKEEITHLEEPVSLTNASNQFIVDTTTNSLICFVADTNSMYQYSKFDFQQKRWQPDIKFDRKPFYGHSNLAISPYDGSLNQLFGYGAFRYHSTQYTVDSSGLSESDLSPKVSPRYLSATGLLGNDLYIYGGYGNIKGNQELGANIYSDMYRYNLETREVVKLWNKLTDNNEELLIAKNIVFPDKRSDKAFALFYPHPRYNSYLVLKEMDIDSRSLTQYADTIPYIFNDVLSEAQLVYSESTKELYAITTHEDTYNNNIELNLYSISYPVIESNAALTTSKENYWWYLWAVVAIGVIVIIILCFRSKNTNQIIEHKTIAVKNSNPGIYLLGGFQVINRNGEDITNSFTTLMKQLLVIIILETQRNNKGVSSIKLKDYLWFDKTETSARNNRGVNIRKIRLILEGCADFSIVSNGGYWKIEHKNSAYCDYIYATEYMSKISTNEAIDNEQLSTLIKIAHMNTLLPNQDADFFDSFKAEYTDRMIDTLATQLSLQESWNNKKLLSDAMMIFDNLNESALRVKCQYMINNGRHGMARIAYDNFAKEYQKSMGRELSSSFEEFVKENS